MSNEWAWALAIIAVPVVVFGVVELANAMRRRRYKMIASRQKVSRRRSSGSLSDRTR